jgi:factor associated with neutral sphingomyelinase activation
VFFLFLARQKMRVSGVRFSLLLLDDDEAYIEDHAATHFPGPEGEGHRGRLRVCTKSLFFEPEQLSLPILRFPFGRLLQVGERADRCVLVASEVIEMRKGGRHYPYVFLSGRQQHAFCLDFLLRQPALLTAFFLLTAELLRCARLPPAESRTALAAIVARHRDTAKPFTLSALVDLSEELLGEALCSRVKPCVVQPCRCVVTSRRLYVQPVDDLDGRRKVVDLASVTQVS